MASQHSSKSQKYCHYYLRDTGLEDSETVREGQKEHIADFAVDLGCRVYERYKELIDDDDPPDDPVLKLQSKGWPVNYELTPSEVLISLSMSELQQLLEEMRKGHGRKPSAVYRKLVDAWLELSLLQDKVLKEAL